MYTEAIKRNPGDYLAYSNRCAAYQKLGEHPTAVKDADKCIEIKPDFAKGYTRKAFSHYCMKEYNKALENYEKALKYDPENADAKNGIETVQRAALGYSENKDSNMSEQERLQRAMADPEIRNILSDPMMRTVLQEMSTDPQAGMRYMQDPQIRTRIEKLIGAGIIKTA